MFLPGEGLVRPGLRAPSSSPFSRVGPARIQVDCVESRVAYCRTCADEGENAPLITGYYTFENAIVKNFDHGSKAAWPQGRGGQRTRECGTRRSYRRVLPNQVWGSGFGVWSLGFGVWSLEFGVRGYRLVLELHHNAR